MQKTGRRATFLGLLTLAMACGKVSIETDAASEIDASGGDGGGDGVDAALPDAADGAFLTVDPPTHEFGPVAVAATSAAMTFTFSNGGDAPATGCSAPVKGGTHADDFDVTADTCGTSDLVAGGSCTVMLTVTPAAAGLRTATLSRTCSEGGTASTTADGIAVNRPMYIFISSVSYNGNLGGLAGADSLCNTLGTGGSVSGPLNKTWRALLSKTTGGTVNAKDRFVWTGPVIDMSAKVVTQNPSVWPWVNAGQGSTIGVNENGGPPDDSYVWTGSTSAGVAKAAGNDCNNWGNGTGSFTGWSGETATFPSSSWFDSFGNGCGDTWFGLYCVGE